MYVCPKCKETLSSYFCAACNAHYPLKNGIRSFLAHESGTSDQRVSTIYDDIYRHHEDAWVDQGRSEAFQAFFHDLVSSFAHEHLLEVGCGEGILLARLPGVKKFGIDPSAHALVRAKARSSADCAVARCEQLPFPNQYFDVVVAVGVMEHFEFIDLAVQEIARVLVPNGHYVSLIQTDMTLWQRAEVKVRQFLYPRLKLKALVEWLLKKARHRIIQPLRKSYSVDSATLHLRRGGLEVVRVITHESDPGMPLGGPHVVVLVARKVTTKLESAIAYLQP